MKINTGIDKISIILSLSGGSIMEKDYGVILLIVFILAVAGGLIYYLATATTTFEEGKIFFELTGGWTQSQVIGDFNQTVFSQVTFSKEMLDESGKSQQAFINVQLFKDPGKVNTTSLREVLIQGSGSSVSNVTINALTFTQYRLMGSQVAHEVSILEKNNYLMIIEYISPVSVMNQTEEAYNSILKTLKVV